jgi:hypothetical protein
MYQDINGNQFESYSQANEYYGGESDWALECEEQARQEECEIEQANLMNELEHNK